MIFVLNSIRPAAYQLVALTKVIRNGLDGVLVADGVGVGKTISAAYIVLYTTEWLRKPALVVCPPTLIPKWLEELGTKFGLRALPIRSLEDLTTAKGESRIARSAPPVYVMSSSLVGKAQEHEYPPISTVVFDEIHNYRNKETLSFSGCLKIALLAKFRVGLSATPINNSVDDLASEFNILLPNYKWDALQAAVEEMWRLDRTTLTSPLVTRFTKDKLGIQFARREVETQAVRYETDYVRRVKEVVSQRRTEGRRSSFYEVVTYYRMAASSPFAFFRSFGMAEWKQYSDPKLQRLETILSSENLDQWLIFCEFEDTVSHIERKMTNWTCFTLTGMTPMDDRPSVIKAFRNTRKSVLIMTSVGSEGLDLQFCNGIINYDIHWNPMRLEQRIGRIDRVGQEKSVVKVHNMIVQGSIDERVMQVILNKLELIRESVFSPGQILGGRPSRSRGEDMFDEATFNQEISESKRLLTSLHSSSEIPSHDYEILPWIDPEYCWPLNLRESATRSPGQTVWLRSAAKTSAWLNSVERFPTQFKELVQYYS